MAKGALGPWKEPFFEIALECVGVSYKPWVIHMFFFIFLGLKCTFLLKRNGNECIILMHFYFMHSCGERS